MNDPRTQKLLDSVLADAKTMLNDSLLDTCADQPRLEHLAHKPQHPTEHREGADRECISENRPAHRLTKQIRSIM